MKLVVLLAAALVAGCQLVFTPSVPGDTADDTGDDIPPGPPDAALGPFTTPVKVYVGFDAATNGWVDDPALTGDELELAYRAYSPEGSDIRIAIDKEAPTGFDNSYVPAVISASRFEVVPELTPDGLTLYYSDGADGAAVSDIAIAVRTAAGGPDWQLVSAPSGLNTSESDSPGGPTSDGAHMIVRRADSVGGAWLVELESTRQGWVEVPNTMAELNTYDLPNNAQLSPDGTRVAFSAFVGGTSDLFIATRAALGEPFAGVQPITELNTADQHELDPWLSADGKRIYYSRQTTDPAPTDVWGIWYAERTTE